MFSNSQKKSSRRAKILSQFSIFSRNKPLLDLLEIQRKSFFDLLEHGIPHELAKIGIFRETAKNSTFTRELELTLNPETYKFISPTYTPKQAILKGKTYACKLYVQATLVVRAGTSEKNLNTSRTITTSILPNPHALPASQAPPKVGLAKLVKQSGNGGILVSNLQHFQKNQLARNVYAKWVGKGFTKLLREFPNQIKTTPHIIFPPTSLRKRGNLIIKGGIVTKGLKTKKIPLNLSTSFADKTKTPSSESEMHKMNRLPLPFLKHVALPPYHRRWYVVQQVPKGVNTTYSICIPSASQMLASQTPNFHTTPLFKAPYHQRWYVVRAMELGAPPIPHTTFGGKGVWGREVVRGLRSCVVCNANEINKTKNPSSKITNLSVATQLYKPHITSALANIPYPTKRGYVQQATSRPLLIPNIPTFGRVRYVSKPYHPASQATLPSKMVRGTWLGGIGGASSATQSLTSSPSFFHTPSTTLPSKMVCGTGEAPKMLSGLRNKGGTGLAKLMMQSDNDGRVLPGIDELKGKNENAQIFRPWIFLGELPLMTKRGHFILNGSPRVIVNQTARCPGIYFQEKRRGVGFEQEIRVSADLIPQRGPWLRIQSDWEGRFWARLKQEGRVKYATLYEAFQEFEKEYNAPLVSLLATSSSQFLKSEIIAFQERKTKEDRQKNALIRLFKNSTRYSLGKIGRFRINQRVHFSPLYESIRQQHHLGSYSLHPLLMTSLVNLSNSLTQIPKNCEISTEEKNTSTSFTKLIDLSTSALPVSTTSALPHTPFGGKHNIPRRGFVSNGVAKHSGVAQQATASKPKETNYLLMAKDIDAIHTCLERLLEGQGFTDDIDHLKNRFIRTSGKLLQQQFELGLQRLNEVIKPLLGNLLQGHLAFLKESSDLNSSKNHTKIPTATLHISQVCKQTEGDLSAAPKTCLNKPNITNTISTHPSITTKDGTTNTKNRKVIKSSNLSTKLINHKHNTGITFPYRKLSHTQIPALQSPQLRKPLTTFTIEGGMWYVTCLHLRSRCYAGGMGLGALRNGVLQALPYPHITPRPLLIPNIPTFGRVRYVSKPYHPASQATLPSKMVRGTWLGGMGVAPFTTQVLTTPLPKVTCNPEQATSLSFATLTPFGGMGEAPKVLAKQSGNGVLGSEVSNVVCGNAGIVAPFRWLRTSKPVNGAFREFFGSNPLSQYMDQTNPLAEITHKRRLSSMGPGGIKRETAGMEVRGIHPTHYGRVCPIETPEGKNAGLVNSPTVYSRVGQYGFMETPLYQVLESQVQIKKWAFFTAQQEEDEKSSLATCDTGLMPFNLLVHTPIPVQTANNPLAHFQQVERSRVGYRALSPVQTISIATALIPFLEHDDANRALMGSNMQRQAIPLLIPERPIVGTGFEPLALVESGQALQATKLGCVSHINANNIIVHSIHSTKRALPQSVLRNTIDNAFIDQSESWSGINAHFDFRHLNPYSKNLKTKERITNLSIYKKDLSTAYIPPKGVSSITPLCFATLNPFGDMGEASIYRASTSRSLLIPNLRYLSKPYHPASQATLPSKMVRGTWLGGMGRAPAPSDTQALTTSAYPTGKQATFTTQLRKPSKMVCGTSGMGYLARGMGLRSRVVRGLQSYGSNRLNQYNKILSISKKIPYKTTTRSQSHLSHLCSSHNLFLLKPFKQTLQLYQRSNQETCLNQRPLVQEGQWVQKGDFLADCSASNSGDLALGKNITVAYMPWEGYNFEDAIVISDRLISDDVYTSLHIERYEIKVNKNSQGKEKITNRIPGTSRFLKHLDNSGIARISSWVQPGDILVGKVVELKRPLSPYERLAWELASRLSPASPEREKWLNKVWLEDISLRLPPGVCGRVVNSQIVSTEWSEKEQVAHPLEVHIYLAVKRKIQIGDKLAGRHGNKGIVSTILPQQDMPYLGDGTSVDMILNPLGVPSRMNLGQIFECLLGLAGSRLGCNFKITPFDEVAGGEASRSLVFLKLYQCRLIYKQQWLFTPAFPGKSKLFDGRTGEPFENWVTVGQAYMLKLIHMVDHKIHARSTGPYSLFTRQPVRGRSRRGGQRLGEMEVWAVEGFGAAYTLQEFLTIKSDDLKARTALQRGFYKQNDVTFGKIHISPGNPEAFKVLVSELQALCLHIQM